MAQRGTRKTSLGNALDSDNNIVADRERQAATARWRSFSDTTQQHSRQKKLFGSLREAMEHEAAEAEALEAVDVSAATAVLDARTLSTLEKTQADEAGYTVIRRRAASDLSDMREQRSQSDRHPAHGQGGERAGRGKRSDRSGGGDRGNRSKPSSSSSAHSGPGRGAKPKRSAQQQQPKQVDAPREPWKSTVVGRRIVSNAAGRAATSPGDCSLDAQRWLEAASSGAVVPAASLPPASPPASAGDPHVSEWTAIPSPMWSGELPDPATAELREAASSQQAAEEMVAHNGTPDEKLHESMLSWLESTLSLDETRSSPP